jgi:3-isopropylmalate/(R)-2-methylmalate dehydratase small subunit
MEPIAVIDGTAVPLDRSDVDTDQIIPARFLKTTDRAGLGRHLFSDWRYDAAGRPRPEFVLNRPEAAGARILVAGDNFGCGSSREHAPWALLDFGIRAVISTTIASIFRSNALKNGIVPVIVDADLHRRLLAAPGDEVSIDVDRRAIRLADGAEAEFPIDPFARYCLLNGIDELAFLLQQEEAIAAFETARSGRD